MKKAVFVVLISMVGLFGVDSDAVSVANRYFNAVLPVYDKYLADCLNGKIPNMANIQEAKCSIYTDEFDMLSKDAYNKIKKDFLRELNQDDVQSLNTIFMDANSMNADTIYNEQIGMPYLFKKIEHKIEFKPEIVSVRVADKSLETKKDYNVEVLFAVSNFKKLYNEVKPNYYTIMHDGILYLKCDNLEKMENCKIDPIY
ncbi:hypothetical protein [Campylobacter mucosalis]|uniref:Uncharacterized protein n=1 Tax=Campylobacter mucosalis CCUG 21559 TaxID=1032067 RepID=A0A6G5QFI7_9BACT|nr:hypothetical protein [Campylobacter mucosalis]QCD44438.1 hypothetical protein CMUC_0639 [Campylobacter mucosalis CCUG 21559]